MSHGADIVVIGGGGAGLMAAVEAAEAGARTILLECQDDTGGSTALSAGHTTLCETRLEPAGHAELYGDLIEAHHHDGDFALSDLYAREAGPTFERLSALGLDFARTVALSHMSRPWAHEMPVGATGGGAQITARLKRAALDRGVDIRVRHRARRLSLVDGRVGSVEASTPEGTETFAATSGVILATGGFTRNPSLIKHYGVAGAERIIPLTGQGSRGDGLLMGMALGAGTSFLTKGIAPTVPTDPETQKGVLMIYAGAVLLNRDGRRFYCESELYNDISKAGQRQPESLMIQVYDARVKAHFATTMWASVLTGFREFSAATLEDLLGQLERACGLDAERAAHTLAAYNMAAPGQDEMGRKHLVGNSGARSPIDQAPFYAAVTRPGTTHFNGGLSIDTAMRVTNVFGEVIDGLYAAGEVVGGFHGTGYLSGTHVGMALIFGRLAGRSAVSGLTAPLSKEAVS